MIGAALAAIFGVLLVLARPDYLRLPWMVGQAGIYVALGVATNLDGGDSTLPKLIAAAGLVTLISQDLSEFALHARAILGLPIPVIRQHGPSASCALLVEGDSNNIRFDNVERALAQPDTHPQLKQPS